VPNPRSSSTASPQLAHILPAASRIQTRPKENLWVAHVDDDARCLHVSRHDGDEVSAAFPLRTIIADAANLGSAGIVLAHNHPSGDARPSDSDFRATRRLAVAADAIDCAVLDPLVFGASDCTSMRQLGCL